jgi:hypothetical protein
MKKNYEKPSVTTFEEKAVIENMETVKVSAPPPSAWSCVRG